VCAEVTDAESAIAAAASHKPDLCLLDVYMPGGGGVHAAQKIHDLLPNAAIVMLTVSTSESDLFDALRAGASGYLLKDTNPDRLPHALEGVLAGEAALPRTLTARLIDEFRDRGRRRVVHLGGRRKTTLTTREWEVLELLNGGMTTAQVAERLSVSPVTVRRHMSDVLRKLQVKSRDEAFRLLDRRSGRGRRSSD
jgi:DNA-binding NarL/FixJ family response regulator